MPVFEYVARNHAGIVKDMIEALDHDNAVTMLTQRGLTPLEVKAQETGLNADVNIPFLTRGPSPMDVAMFTRQMATLLKRQVSMVRALDTMERQATNKEFKRMITVMRKDVVSGRSLVEAMAQYPKTFSKVYLGIAAAGDEAGNIDESLTYLADMLIKGVELNRKIRGALTYPGVVMLAAIGITYFLMTTIVPQFASMLTDVGGKLPPITVAVIFVSDLLRKSPLLIVGVLIVLVVGLRYYYSTPNGKYQIDRLTLKMPVFGNLIMKASMARLSRSMAMMLGSGMPLIEVLRLSREVVGNSVIAEAVDNVAVNIASGTSISQSFLSQEHVFPPILTSMVSTGDETGAIDEMLLEVAQFYDIEVEEITSSLASLIEPIMTIFLGLVVGTIVAALLLPYFSIISNLQGG